MCLAKSVRVRSVMRTIHSRRRRKSYNCVCECALTREGLASTRRPEVRGEERAAGAPPCPSGCPCPRGCSAAVLLGHTLLE